MLLTVDGRVCMVRYYILIVLLVGMYVPTYRFRREYNNIAINRYENPQIIIYPSINDYNIIMTCIMYNIIIKLCKVLIVVLS